MLVFLKRWTKWIFTYRKQWHLSLEFTNQEQNVFEVLYFVNAHAQIVKPGETREQLLSRQKNRKSLAWTYIMLFAGWEIYVVKNCIQGLESAAWGWRLRQYFPVQGHSFSLWRLTQDGEIMRYHPIRLQDSLPLPLEK